jgi:bifunctional UDP-N-acetylglucosamine pyrophosphorylase/glucosamine-1-phosphate N-acetyltransferase
MAKNITAIVLAAGQGTRMNSTLPKVLHAAAGRSLIKHVLNGLNGAGISKVRLVVGFGEEEVRKHLGKSPDIQFFRQEKQLGTADAVKSSQLESISDNSDVLICNGDHPLITAEDYAAALNTFNKTGCDILVVSCEVRNPTGFGRIVRSQKGKITSIVEEKDASLEEKRIAEINSGLYIAKSNVLKKLIPLIKNDNAKSEYYITDLIRLALDENLQVEVSPQAPRVVRGVNNQRELALAAKALYRRQAREFSGRGVTLVDGDFTYIEAEVIIGEGTTIQPGVMISGATEIGKNCLIEAHCQIKDSKIANNVEIRWGSLIEKSQVADQAIIGPYARLRPETLVGEGAHVGNFVELKKTTLGARAKANHLTYLGDAEIGEDTNIGCGTITCNYATDKKKYKTKIGKRVFVGSDSQFVAPVTIGDDAVIGSGSTITKDVPEKALAVARGKQYIKTNYNKE